MNHDPPSEKERKNMVIVVSCVGLLITVLAATMVGITLGLSHLLEEPDIFSGRNHSGKHLKNCIVVKVQLLKYTLNRHYHFYLVNMFSM